MHAMLRTYTGDNPKKLLTRLEERKSEVEKLMHGVPGLISWGAVRTGEGGMTFTRCQDKKSRDESARVAREWVQKHASDIAALAPTVSDGPVIMRITA